MVAIAAANKLGIEAVMFYLAAYTFMNIGAFAVVTHFARQGERYVNVEDFAGLGWKQPVMAGLFAVFLLSLIGVPLTGGFFGKFYIFKAALDANLIWLAILGLLNSAVGAYYYLRILVVMYMREPGEATATIQPPSMGVTTAVCLSALGTLVLGIFPSVLLNFVNGARVLGK
jgi:NADH-quinone oxidoreductase subunit N